MIDTIRTGPVRRRRRTRLLAGVCSGVAERYRLDLGAVRFVVLLTSAAGGAGLIAYGVAWAVLPLEDSDPDVADRHRRRPDRAEQLAVVLMGLGVTLLLRSAGLWFSDAVGLVGATGAVGVALVWGSADGPADLGRGGALRIAAGLTLLGAGFLTLLFLAGDLETMGRTLLSASLAAAGVALLLGPYVSRLADQLGEERRARIRVEERAEIAAHLHDGVLQTLAMIQRRAGDEREVATLAGRQERELREWLHGRPEVDTATLASHARAELASVEDDHGARVELICVGDLPLDDRLRALVAAAREAATNASLHAGTGKVDVYVEVEDDAAVAFIRDRGAGFDPASVPADRRGLAQSIVGRMARAGGEAVVRSRPGEGTEVRLRLPLRPDRQRGES